MLTKWPFSLNTPSASIAWTWEFQCIRSPNVCTAPTIAGTPQSASISSLNTSQTVSYAARQSLPNRLRSNLKYTRSRFGMVNTHSADAARRPGPPSAADRPEQQGPFPVAPFGRLRAGDGQHDRWRQENATKNSFLQSGQRTRANPSLRSPHFMNLSIDDRITGRQYPFRTWYRSGYNRSNSSNLSRTTLKNGDASWSHGR